MSLKTKVENLLNKINKKADITQELQTEIDPSVLFRRNSVNIIIGKRGSGKTYNVFRELLKLKFVKNHRYTKMLYISDKPYDDTYERVKDELPIPVEIVPYNEAYDKISEVAQAKAAVKEMEEKNIKADDLEDEARATIEEVIGESIDKIKDVYHTFILFDDCQNVFSTKTKENKQLIKLLFENRQPKITYFLVMQDGKGLDSSIKETADTIWIFGGFSKAKFSYIIRNIPTDKEREELYNDYKKLTRNQALIFRNYIEGNDVKVLKD